MKKLIFILLLFSTNTFSSSDGKYVGDFIDTIVPCSSEGIGFGVSLTEKNACVRKLKASDAPKDAIHPKNFEEFEGRTVNRAIKKGEAIGLSDIADFPMQNEIDRLNEIVERLKRCYDRCDADYLKAIESLK